LRCELAPWSDIGRSTLRPYSRRVSRCVSTQHAAPLPDAADVRAER